MCEYKLVKFILLSAVLLFVVHCSPAKNYGRFFQDNFYKTRNTCNCVCGASNRHMRVVGGNITKIHEFPWLAALSRYGVFHCGASVITRRHLVTAAHCVEGFEAKELTVSLAEHDREPTDGISDVVIRGVRKIIKHEGFDPRTFNNDIAVLEMDAPIQFGAHIQPACLPDTDFADYAGKFAVVAGWGQTGEQEETSRVLRKVVVPVWNKDDCFKAGYEVSKISENMFCAGYPDGQKDACQGDSGGPLLINRETGNMEIIGLVSWGRGCARPNLPGIYTKVSNYLDWLQESLEGECLCPSVRLNPRRA